jgi:GNAT superfamily N-acetyltransferase
MSLDQLYSDDIEAGIQRDLVRPPPPAAPSFSIWGALTGGAKGVPAGAMEAGASWLDLLGPAQREALRHPKPAVLADQPDDTARRISDAIALQTQGGNLRARANEFAPDPATAHTAEQVMFGLTRIGSKAVASVGTMGPYAGGAALAAEETNTRYRELIAKGVDPTTALKVAGIEGGVAGASVALPMVGPTIRSTLGLAAASGPGAYVAQEYAAKKVLEKAGYHDEASLHDPTDPLGLAISTVLPAVFGGVHIAGLRRGAPAPQLADVVQNIESNGRRFDQNGQLLTSPKGAQGEMQVMPGTSRDPGFGVTPARDSSPEELARVGRDYIAAMQTRYGDDAKALAAYNAGPGAVDAAVKLHGDAWLAHLPDETQKYVAKGMKQVEGAALAHAASDPATVDAARTRVTDAALERSLPAPEARADVLRAADDLAAGDFPSMRPADAYASFFEGMEPKFDVPRESQGSLRLDENGQPEIRTSKILLTDAHPTERIEAVGQELTRFAIRSPDGKVLGHTELLLQDGKVVSLYDIETTPGLRSQGVGAKVIEAITSLEPDRKIEISNIVDEAVPFWEKVGAQVSDGNRSPTLDWHQFAESHAGRSRGAARRSEELAGHSQAADAGAAAGDRSAPRGEARELTPEEAAQFGFHDFESPLAPSEGANALPPPDSVALAREPVEKTEAADVTARRTSELAKESPDLKVKLPGSDETLSLEAALERAKAEHTAELEQGDWVQAAVRCALSFG